MKKYLLFIFWAPIFSLILVCGLIYYLFNVWTFSGPTRNFEIGHGEPFSRINYRLHQEGIISSAKIFYHYVKYEKSLTKFKEGIFEIKSGVTMPQVFYTLTKGTPLAFKVTIPEGKNIYEIAKILEDSNVTIAKDFVMASMDANFLKIIGVPYDRAEGYLYPDTYLFSPHSPAKVVVKTMVEECKKRLATMDYSQSSLSPHEVMTLASIVEKETGVPEERPVIAGVFHNRLKKKMRLQSDPTTIYGIYNSYSGNLKREHLQQQTPYNTYKIEGLPPGPIANPGVHAIKAVLQPADHQYLYFVSKNDGTHAFSETYQQHIERVKYFQQTAINRRGKSWRNRKIKDQ